MFFIYCQIDSIYHIHVSFLTTQNYYYVKNLVPWFFFIRVIMIIMEYSKYCASLGNYIRPFLRQRTNPSLKNWSFFKANVKLFQFLTYSFHHLGYVLLIETSDSPSIFWPLSQPDAAVCFPMVNSLLTTHERMMGISPWFPAFGVIVQMRCRNKLPFKLFTSKQRLFKISAFQFVRHLIFLV